VVQGLRILLSVSQIYTQPNQDSLTSSTNTTIQKLEFKITPNSPIDRYPSKPIHSEELSKFKKDTEKKNQSRQGPFISRNSLNFLKL